LHHLKNFLNGFVHTAAPLRRGRRATLVRHYVNFLFLALCAVQISSMHIETLLADTLIEGCLRK
jgi:hypothetical protein